MPLSEPRKRPHSEILEIYAGPEDFMEAGARGFLITTIPEREEPAIDQAMKMLRKACVKLYGGMKPQVKSTTALFSNGYIAVDFMDPDTVTVLPNPELKSSKTTKDQEEVKEEEDGKEKSDKNDEDPENVQMTDKGDEKKEGEEDAQKEEEMEKEGGDAEEQDEEMEADKSLDKSAEAEEDASDQNTSSTKGKSKDDVEEKKKKEGDDDKKKKEGDDDKKKKEGDDDKTGKAKESPEKRSSDGGKSKADSQKSKSSREEERRRRDNKKRKREVDTTPKWPLMKAPYKFKAFRTELRNIMFIKSNIPDPLVLIKEIMDLILDRQPLKADSINQLLPIQGICNYSYWELEVMSRRVLAPFFLEDLEEPPSFGILMYDKLCEPGADVLAEIVRSAIWSINPLAWQSAPLSDTDITIHLELIGSKIVLSAMTHYMKYRQYSPFCVAEMGEGKPEDPEEQERRRIEREKSDRKGRSRSRSDRPHRTEDTPSGKGKEKDKADDCHEKADAKKDGKDKTEESVKEEKKGEDGEKSQEDGKDAVKKEEAAESGEKEWKKTRRGKRGGVRKKN